ncbi:MAG: methyl-accepting chemotaxis protein [Halopseudomonas sp.]|uniref:methyl-accepting chemotaxis protein n=1 Tax=Halopseudomonas sp. TaxID=2901191 RepID=UPI003001C563
MLIRNMNIGLRAAICFAALALLMVILGVLSLAQMKHMDQMSDQVAENWLPAIIETNEMGIAIGRVRALTLRALTLTDGAEMVDTLQRVQGAKADMQAAAQRYEALISSEEERTAFGGFRAASERYLAQQQRVIELAQAGLREQASAAVSGGLNQFADEMMVNLRRLTELNQRGADAAAVAAEDSYVSGFRMVVGLLIAAVVLTVFLALMLTRSIVRPLAEALDAAKVIAAGDLTRRFQIVGRDEPAQLLIALRDMQRSLSETIQSISSSSGQLASAAEELNAVTEDASRGLRQQNNEMEQAATAVNEMTTAVEEVARNAVSTSEASRDTDSNARSGGEKVRQTVASINELAGDVTATADSVEGLAKDVHNISQVLNVIRAVAEQTNLLALNAAIEAARAGEQGRGFAVVADEVRALAHRTQQSTEEIERMISVVQQGAASAVAAMQKSMGQANHTLGLAQSAGEALEDITRAVGSINERNMVIASASEEQAQVAREVDRNLVNIRDLSMQTAAGAEQTSSASQELSRLAVTLNELVARFKL